MKKLSLFITSLACLFASSSLMAHWEDNDLTPTIPIIQEEVAGFQKVPDVAQYKKADWSHVIGMARGVSLEEARNIANNNPEITFFFYTKGYQMVLENEDGYRQFKHGDAVFFSGIPWWGSAPGLADGYIKTQQ